MFLPLSQQLCQSQGHGCHKKKSTSYFGPSTNQILNTEAPCREEACWVSTGTPAASGALWLIRQIRKRALWMKTQTALCVLPAGVYLWHFQVAGFCGFQSWFSARKHDHHVDDEDVIKARFRQTASVRTLALQDCERDSGYIVCDKEWPTKRAVCGTGRPDSGKWDCLSASLLQVPLLLCI